jgi:ribosomal protein S18 acetylase RimI-like enzyme
MDQNLTAGSGAARVEFLADLAEGEVGAIIGLYKEAGWWEPGADNEEMVRRIVAGSHCFAAAYVGGELVGMARAVSDGASDAYIQDVTVKASYRRRGIAGEMIRAVTARLIRDGVMWIALVAERGSESLYGGLGFSPMQGAVAMRYAPR